MLSAKFLLHSDVNVSNTDLYFVAASLQTAPVCARCAEELPRMHEGVFVTGATDELPEKAPLIPTRQRNQAFFRRPANGEKKHQMSHFCVFLFRFYMTFPGDFSILLFAHREAGLQSFSR